MVYKSLIYMNIIDSFGGSWIFLEMQKLAWGARGREFESRHADHFLPMKSTGYSPQGCDPFFFVRQYLDIAPLIAPLFRFPAALVRWGATKTSWLRGL
jgi:hypothetical protein